MKKHNNEKEKQPIELDPAAAEAENAIDSGAEDNLAEDAPADRKEAEAVSPEEALRKEVAELKDQLLRKEADYQNYRKRMAREVGDARRLGLCETIVPFLQLFDLFAMAMKAADKSDNVAALKQGLTMIQTEYAKALDELGVKEFHAAGEKFDPLLHDAVSSEPSDTVPEGVVIKEWNSGYKLGDRLLRPARVVVSAGPEKTGETGESAGE